MADVPKARFIAVTGRSSARVSWSLLGLPNGVISPSLSFSAGPGGTWPVLSVVRCSVYAVVFTLFLVIEAHGGRCFRTPCPFVVRSRSKCQRQRPDPNRNSEISTPFPFWTAISAVYHPTRVGWRHVLCSSRKCPCGPVVVSSIWHLLPAFETSPQSDQRSSANVNVSLSCP